jgi:hypothetical protein
MRLTDHVTLNFNKNMSIAAVFMNTEKAFDTTWHTGLLYKLSKFQLSVNLIELISLYLSHKRFRISVESELPMQRKTEAGVP